MSITCMASVNQIFHDNELLNKMITDMITIVVGKIP